MVVVEEGPDAADDWIAENIQEADVAITADIPLAARCLERGARVIGSNGRPFDDEMIGMALSTRELKSQLREEGTHTGGPSGISQRDRSRFLAALDRAVQLGLRDVGS
jgi:uncharacterized protein YaiI (UPF0178 family)